jgi:hypothetical protein
MCPYCGTAVDEQEKGIVYIMRFHARMDTTAFGDAVVYEEDSIDSEAICGQCGNALDYDDVVS